MCELHNNPTAMYHDVISDICNNSYGLPVTLTHFLKFFRYRRRSLQFCAILAKLCLHITGYMAYGPVFVKCMQIIVLQLSLSKHNKPADIGNDTGSFAGLMDFYYQSDRCAPFRVVV